MPQRVLVGLAIAAGNGQYEQRQESHIVLAADGSFLCLSRKQVL